MSIEEQAIVMHHSKASGTALVVLWGIANHSGDGGAWPSVSTLAKYGRCSPRQVQRAVRALVELGELRVDENAGGMANTPDYRRTNRYTIKLHCPPSCDRSSQHRDQRKRPRAVPDVLDLDPVTSTSPGDVGDGGPVTPVSPHPVTPVSPEPVHEPAIEHQGADRNAGVRAVRPSQPSTASLEPRCREGHPMTDETGAGVPVCRYGDYAVESIA